MNLRTIFGYLIGRRTSIEQIARTPAALLVGLMFVFSAGFAREYDGEDLSQEPWHLLLPLAASLASCTLLFLLMTIVSLVVGVRGQNWFKNYGSFLTLFWMTAPLAWLYAIPFERFNSAGDAMRLNLALLGVVALWRVALMVRVVAVMFGTYWWEALFFVMLFADIVALQAIQLTPRPIIGMMGGIRHTDSERMLADTTFCVVFWLVVSLPLWVLGSLAILLTRKFSSRLGIWSPRFQSTPERGPVAVTCWVLAGLAVVAGLGLLPLGQPQQQLRTQVETAFAEGRTGDGLTLMSAHRVDEFPPHYDPPPRIGYGQFKPPLTEVMVEAIELQAAPWVIELYQQKIEFHAGSTALNLQQMSDEELESFVALLDEMPNGKEVAENFDSWVFVSLHRRSERAPELSERRRRALERLEQLLPPRPDSQKNADAES